MPLLKFGSPPPKVVKKRGRHSAISDQDRQKIVELSDRNVTTEEIAQRFNRAPCTITRVVRKAKAKEAKEGYFVFDSKMFGL